MPITEKTARNAATKPPAAKIIGATLGARVRNRRRSLNWPQIPFAALIGISQGYLAEIESDKKRPSVTTLQAIAQVCGATVGELLGE